MSEDLIGYADMIDTAMRGVVRSTLERVREHGLPGDHHCYISFDTNHSGVNIAEYLKERYPDEMTIVLQHQFWDLEVLPDRFFVTLSFNRKKEPLEIPFSALTAFADPSIKFGLQFHQPSDADDSQQSFERMLDDLEPEGDMESRSSAKVITLDAFRDKPTKSDS